MKKINKKLLLGSIVLALLSLEVCFGILFGYFIGKIFGGKKAGESGLIKSLVFDFGKYRLHLHHWFYSLGILASIVILNFIPPFPQFSLAFLGGMVVHGVTYPDWYQILKTIE